jgi:alkylhydroperoxidase/carboxymuconolactone decarboxylase family protein YurZ
MSAKKTSSASTIPQAVDRPYTAAQLASGDWNPLWDTLREWDPEFMEGYLAFRSVPHRNGPLPAKYKELVLIAINVATTHMYGPGVRRHMQNALKLGATRDEILEVIQLTTVLGIHACNVGIPILAEELQKLKPPPAEAKKSPRRRAKAI